MSTQLEELSPAERVAILAEQRRAYRIELERLKNNLGLAQFLNDDEQAKRIRADAEKVVRAIEFFDQQIVKAREK